MHVDVSVVVPTYNAERTIERCISTMLSQEDVVIEVLVCDDGSSDNTLRIVEDLARHDGRLRILSAPHAGVAAARNRGLDAAQGSHVMFVDADDWLEPGAVSALLKAEEAYGSELTYGDYRLVFPGTERIYHEFDDAAGVIDPDTFFSYLTRVDDRRVFGYCWRVLFSRDLIQRSRARFDERITISEDFDFLMQCLASCPCVARTYTLVYAYDRTAPSLVSRYVPRLLESDELANERLAQLAAEHPELHIDLSDLYAMTAFEALANWAKSGSGVGCGEAIRRMRTLLRREPYASAVGRRGSRSAHWAVLLLLRCAKVLTAPTVFAYWCYRRIADARRERAW